MYMCMYMSVYMYVTYILTYAYVLHYGILTKLSNVWLGVSWMGPTKRSVKNSTLTCLSSMNITTISKKKKYNTILWSTVIRDITVFYSHTYTHASLKTFFFFNQRIWREHLQSKPFNFFKICKHFCHLFLLLFTTLASFYINICFIFLKSVFYACRDVEILLIMNNLSCVIEGNLLKDKE